MLDGRDGSQPAIHRKMKGFIMATVPNTLIGKIQFFETHLPIWAVNPTAIGLTALQVADLTTLTATARATYESTLAARNAARALTGQQTDDVATMYDLGADLIKTIRAFAQTTNDNSVYTAAQVPPPSPPTTLGPPATPTNLVGTLTNLGKIKLTWVGSRVGGTSFTISRSVGDTGPWVIIGTSEETSFTDPVVPSGVESISYSIVAARAGGASDATPPLVINFGNTASGSTASDSVSSGDGLTIAA
jgi:hypothetical protein